MGKMRVAKEEGGSEKWRRTMCICNYNLQLLLLAVLPDSLLSIYPLIYLFMYLFV